MANIVQYQRTDRLFAKSYHHATELEWDGWRTLITGKCPQSESIDQIRWFGGVRILQTLKMTTMQYLNQVLTVVFPWASSSLESNCERANKTIIIERKQWRHCGSWAFKVKIFTTDDGKSACGEEKGYCSWLGATVAHAEAAVGCQSCDANKSTRHHSHVRTAATPSVKPQSDVCIKGRRPFGPTWYFSILRNMASSHKWSSLYSRTCRQIWVRITTNKSWSKQKRQAKGTKSRDIVEKGDNLKRFNEL